MLRYLKYAFLFVTAVCLVTMALANTQDVTLQLMPQELADLTGLTYQITVPMFAVVFGAVALGLLIGFVWEWLRETKHRTQAARMGREARQLEREVRPPEARQQRRPGRGACSLGRTAQGWLTDLALSGENLRPAPRRRCERGGRGRGTLSGVQLLSKVAPLCHARRSARLGGCRAGVAKVALVVDGSDALLDEITRVVPLDFLQLHGQESPSRVAEVKARFGLR